MTLKDDIQILREGRKTTGRLLKGGQAPTDRDWELIADAVSVADRLGAAQKSYERDRELHRRLGEALRDGTSAPNAGGSGLFSAKSAAQSLAQTMSAGGRKALAPSGSETATAGLTELRPIELGRVATSLLAVVPARTVRLPPTYGYLRQKVRDNRAAPVVDGAVKPTSAYGLERVEDRLRVVAHLSEPVNRYWIEDADDLRVFVEDELTYGLDVAVEQQLLNGDGSGENMRGLLNVPGIQSQAWSVDGYETVRRSLTKLQLAGATEYVVALSPVDFEAMNLVRSTSGEFLATNANYAADSAGATAPPYGPVALRSWGARLVLSTALAPGQALAFDPSAVTLYTDGQIRLEWNGAMRFDSNELVARCEGRFGVAVKRPAMVVSIDMAEGQM